MDKACLGCIYQGFRTTSKHDVYGFCLKEKAWKDIEIPHDTNSYVADIICSIFDGNVPSCMTVQTLYKGKCPYKKIERTDTVKEVHDTV